MIMKMDKDRAVKGLSLKEQVRSLMEQAKFIEQQRVELEEDFKEFDKGSD